MAKPRAKKPKQRVLEPAVVIGATGLRAPAPVIALAMSRDGARVATGDEKGLVHVFERATGACVFRAKWEASDHRGRHGIQRLAFTHDGSVITGLTGIIGHGNLCAGHIASGTTWFETPNSWDSYAFSRDCREIVGVTHWKLEIVNARDGTSSPLELPERLVPREVAWSPDGKWIVMSDSQENPSRCGLVVIDGESFEIRGEYSLSLGIEPYNNRLAFFEGKLVTLTSNPRPSAVWFDPATGTHELRPIEGADEWMHFELVPERAEAVVLAYRKPRDVIDLRTGQRTHTLPVDTDHVAAGSGAIVTSHGVALRFWDTDWNEIAAAPGLSTEVTDIAFSPDSAHVMTCDETGLTTWRLDGSFVSKLAGEAPRLTRDGTIAIMVRNERTVAVDIASGLERTALPEAMKHGTPSPDTKWLAGVHSEHEGKVILYSFETGEVAKTFEIEHGNRVKGYAFSHDGSMVAGGGWRATIKVYDVQSGELITSTGIPDSYGERAFSFSHDGKLLANGNLFRALRLWHLPSGKLAHDLKGHRRKIIWATAFSPDDKLLASCDEADIRVWNVQTGALVAVARHGAQCLAFSPDGKWLAAGGNGEAYVFAL